MKLFETIRAESKIAFVKAFKEFFDKHPRVQAVTWTQYTPYFNDGEPCEFRVGDAVCYIPPPNKEVATPAQMLEQPTWALAEGEVDTRIPGGELLEDALHNAYALNHTFTNSAAFAGLALEFKELAAGLRANPEILLMLLGDHQRVIITRDGSIVAEEFEHE